MNTELISKTWDSLGHGHLDVIQEFYSRFFNRYPEYQSHFPEQMDHQMKKMVETMAMVARLAENEDIVEARMVHIGQRHQKYHLGKSDLENFKTVFLEVLGEKCSNKWSNECQQAWNEAFDKVIIPLVMKGLTSH